jgi:hypothetical protein
MATITDSKCPVTFNEPWSSQLHPFNVAKLDDFAAGVPEMIEKGKGQIAIYYPQHSSFEQYDVILVVWDKEGIRRVMIGYDLKEGRGRAGRQARDDLFLKSFVIRGQAQVKTATDAKGWILPSKEEISSFFGVSGKYWTPERWKDLNSS